MSFFHKSPFLLAVGGQNEDLDQNEGGEIEDRLKVFNLLKFDSIRMKYRPDYQGPMEDQASSDDD